MSTLRKPSADDRPAMPLVAALRVLAQIRSDEIVVTSMGAMREWPRLSQHPLDLLYYPSAMGQLPLVSLGLALAQPDRQVIGIVGDGSLLMNLGCLATIKSSGATNLTLVLINNGVYEVTGSQHTAGGLTNIDFGALASACQWPSVMEFNDLTEWQSAAPNVLANPGPRFLSLRAQAVRDDFELTSPGPVEPRLTRFREALGNG